MALGEYVFSQQHTNSHILYKTVKTGTRCYTVWHYLIHKKSYHHNPGKFCRWNLNQNQNGSRDCDKTGKAAYPMVKIKPERLTAPNCRPYRDVPSVQ